MEITITIENLETGEQTRIISPSIEMAVDELYKVQRHNDKNAKEEEKSLLIDRLTPAQEEKLKDAHMKQYHGTDDDSVDDYENWLCYTVTLDEIKQILA